MQGRIINTMILVEGIEVAAISVRVNGGIMTPAEAAIEIPAVSAAHKIKPRSLVHIFFAETSYAEGELADKTRSVTKSLKARDSYCLLFVGEVVAYKYVNAGGLRHIVLQCQDFTTYWQQAKLYWGTNKLSSYTYKRAIAAGSVQVFDGKKRVDNTDAFLNLLLAKPTTVPKLTGILGGVISLLESATGVYRPDVAKNFRGVNDFIGQAELRLQLTQTLGVSPDDNTSSKYIDATAFKQYFKRLAQSMSSQASFMDLVGLFLERVHYQWTSVLMPPYMPRNKDKKLKSKVMEYKTTKFKPLKETNDDVKLIDALAALVQQRLDQQKTRYTSGEVVSPGDGTQYSEYRVVNSVRVSVPDNSRQAEFNATRPVQSFLSNDWTARSVAVRQQLGQQGQALFESRIGTAYNFLISVQKVLRAIVEGGRVLSATANGLVSSVAGYPQHTATNLKYILRFLQKAKSLLADGASTTTGKLVDGADIELGDRLHCFLFLPDLYMAPPPTCNVLFPDQYTQIQFGRQWMSELTRLTMHTRTQTGQDAKDLYFAPNTDILGGPKDSTVEQALTKNVSFMMPHEKYTGVIAAIEAIEEASIFRKIHEEVKKAEKDAKKPDPKKPTNAKVSGEAQFSPMEHLRRAANFLFFQRRFANRSISVTARFSPQIVTGLPMLVLDGDPGVLNRFGTFDPDGRLKTIDDEGKETSGAIARPSTGTHFVGLVAAVQHGIDGAGQAFTQIQLVKCREHTEGIDIFLDADDVEGIADKNKALKVVTEKTQVIHGWQYFDPNPNKDESFDKQFKLNDTTFRADPNRPVYTRPDSKTVKTVPLKKGDQLYANGATTAVSVANPGDGKSYADAPTTGSGTGAIPTRGIRTQATSQPVVVYRDNVNSKTYAGEIKFSFEQTATPPWFADIYLPHNIGKQFYEPMIGCKSVLDESALTGGSGVDAADIVKNKERVYLKLSYADGTQRQVEIPTNVLLPATTVQESAERLAETWRGLTDSGANVALFVDAYTRRNCGSLPEIMGDKNPWMSFLTNREIEPIPEKEADREDGFHGDAYGRFTNLQDKNGAAMNPDGLVEAIETTASDAKKDAKAKAETGSARPVSGSADGRLERWDAVWNYQQQAMRFRQEIK